MTTATLPETRQTPADVLRLEDQGLFELVDGKLLEKPMSSVATKTAGLITARLIVYAVPMRAGDVFPEQTFRCFATDPELVRRPGVAFIVTDRLAAVEKEGHVTVVPDLAVEVISPNDKVYDLEEKLEDYRAAGIKLIWVVNPKHRWIHVHSPGQPIAEFRENDTITGGSVLPGFSITVRDLLPV